ncbi:MAG: TrbI/VirB10 family protein [Pseudomonadota bacterium]|nr:TrbI/VirB10 family protein [Pseudomonadota bacterium]
MMQGFWEKMTPKTKRIAVIALAGLGLLVLVGFFTDESDTRPKTTSREESIRHILTDSDTREVGLEALAADLEVMTRENRDLRKELERIQARLEKGERSLQESRALSRDMARVQEQLQKLREEGVPVSRKEQDDASPDVAEDSSEGDASNAPASAESRDFSDNYELAGADPEDFFRNAPVPETSPSTPEGERGRRGEKTQPKGMMIASYSSYTASEDESEEQDAKEKEVFMPAGSIITGVLINGMDAPTAQGARQDPFPATLRIQKEAILPNRYRADIRECFLIVSGYGDLSSERAYLRGETLSCVKDNGDVIEAPLDSYAVGEDGKAGVRGRLVSKQGQIIAKSLMAGFLSGAAEAFDVDAIPTLSLENNGRTQYQENDFTRQFAQGAAAKGASNALDRIAQFYIDMAEGIFPVIEIDAGRQVEVIITRGSSLKVRGAKAE